MAVLIGLVVTGCGIVGLIWSVDPFGAHSSYQVQTKTLTLYLKIIGLDMSLDVFKPLPFYKNLAQLSQPLVLGETQKSENGTAISMISVPMDHKKPLILTEVSDAESLEVFSHTTIRFALTTTRPDLLTQISDPSNKVRIQLRISRREDLAKRDVFPLELMVEVNSRSVALPVSAVSESYRCDFGFISGVNTTKAHQNRCADWYHRKVQTIANWLQWGFDLLDWLQRAVRRGCVSGRQTQSRKTSQENWNQRTGTDQSYKLVNDPIICWLIQFNPNPSQG